jgi:hypothetical protein
VAAAVAEAMPSAEIARIWLFAPVRRGAGARVRVYTASYTLLIRGRERGHGKVAVQEVAESPAAVVDEVIRGVQERAGETDPPVEIDAGVWFEEAHDESAPQG